MRSLFGGVLISGSLKDVGRKALLRGSKGVCLVLKRVRESIETLFTKRKKVIHSYDRNGDSQISLRIPQTLRFLCPSKFQKSVGIFVPRNLNPAILCPSKSQKFSVLCSSKSSKSFASFVPRNPSVTLSLEIPEICWYLCPSKSESCDPLSLKISEILRFFVLQNPSFSLSLEILRFLCPSKSQKPFGSFVLRNPNPTCNVV